MARSGYGPAAGPSGSHASTGSCTVLCTVLGPRGPYVVTSTKTILGPRGPVSYPVGVGSPNSSPSSAAVSYGVSSPIPPATSKGR